MGNSPNVGIGRQDRLNNNLSAIARNPIVESPKFGENPLYPLTKVTNIILEGLIVLNNNVQGQHRAKMRNIIIY